MSDPRKFSLREIDEAIAATGNPTHVVAQPTLESLQRDVFLRLVGDKICTDHRITGEHVTDFVRALNARLAQGAIEYGDTSPSKPYAVLADEIQQELLDVAGWCCQLWRKVNADIGEGETMHDRHPKAMIESAMRAEAAKAFVAWNVWREAIMPLCKELDARR